jgi:hypothetical protein
MSSVCHLWFVLLEKKGFGDEIVKATGNRLSNAIAD